MAGIGEGTISLTAGTSQPDAGAPRQRASTSKVVAASTIGTIIESYDFFVNASAAALVFGPLFFPASDSTVSTLAALSVYATLHARLAASSSPVLLVTESAPAERRVCSAALSRSAIRLAA